MAPVIERLRRAEGIETRVCVTAQHRQMLDQVLELFGIVPDYDLDLMEPNQDLARLTSAILQGLDPVVREFRPDWVLVQGDTTTVMAASAAGLLSPDPGGACRSRAANRRQMAAVPGGDQPARCRGGGRPAFRAHHPARDNLLREGVAPDRVSLTGNPVIDALQAIARRPYDPERGPLAGIPLDQSIVLVTAHRRENFGEPFERIFSAIHSLADAYRGKVQFVYPVHLNPQVREPAHRILGELAHVRLIEPLDYQPMVYLMQRCRLILTDSGGLQEEGPALGKPVLVMRQVTERPEAVEAGTARLVGTEPDRIRREVMRLLDDPEAYAAMAHAENPFGDGHAAERIVTALLEKWSLPVG